jgi:diaminopimelate epimerase
MNYNFYKYQGAGNDFIIFDCINEPCPNLSEAKIEQLCDRRFGIGADGLMYILPHESLDFKMKYFNNDGKESTMCGNGGRCIAHLAYHLNLSKSTARFDAIDGYHEAIISDDIVALGMIDVHSISRNDYEDYILNTGSPHYVHFSEINQLEQIVPYGKSIRYNNIYAKDGINVNIVAEQGDTLHVATYERGVEDETLACGTGVTAVAIAYGNKNGVEGPIKIKTKGGDMKIHFQADPNGGYKNVVLEGPAVFVFKGSIEL